MATLPLRSNAVSTADHVDAPLTMADRPADIVVTYAWLAEDSEVVTAKRKILDGIHIDTPQPDIDVRRASARI